MEAAYFLKKIKYKNILELSLWLWKSMTKSHGFQRNNEAELSDAVYRCPMQHQSFGDLQQEGVRFYAVRCAPPNSAQTEAALTPGGNS